MNKQEYVEAFKGKVPLSAKLRTEKALELALDIRKFEIELYWKRATYFWTFIAAAFGGYAVIYTRGQGKNAWILSSRPRKVLRRPKNTLLFNVLAVIRQRRKISTGGGLATI